MGNINDYYDFHCGNDPRLVKIAINNDTFHTITVEANIAKTIDFSGGTRKVEAIRLNKCFKTTRVIWPERTGAIKRLYIHHADTLAKLDVSALISLEEISIVDCRSLKEIAGLSDSLKEVNIHNVKLSALQVSHLTKLQKINLVTSTNHIDLNLSTLEQLQIASISTSQSAYDNELISKIDMEACRNLHTVYIDIGDNIADINISGSIGLKDIALICGTSTKLTGLEDCKDLEFYHTDTILIMKERAARMAKKLRSNNPDEKISDLIKMSKVFYGLVKHCKAGIHDRETVIQESGSQIEVDKGSAAKIRLLGTPIDIEMTLNKKDLSKELRQAMLDNTYFPSSVLLPIYHIPELPNTTHDYGITLSRMLTKKNAGKSLSAWLENTENLTPNLLLVNQDMLHTSALMNILDQLVKNPKYLIYEKKKYLLQPFDKIILRGDWYYIKNRLPLLAGLINQIPRSALAAQFVGGVGSSINSLAHYQHLLNEVNALLAQHLVQNNRSLTHRGKNLQILKQVAESKRLAQDFFYYLTIAMNEQVQLLRNPDDQVNINAAAQTPQNADVQSAQQPQATTKKNPDITPQHEIRSEIPIDQVRTDAEANTTPDSNPKKSLQEPINAEHKSKGLPDVPPLPAEPNNQILIVAAKKLAIAVKDMINNTAVYQEQILIHAEADTTPDLHPKRALQSPIKIKHKAKGLANAPPLSADPHNQELLTVAKKLAIAVKKMTDNTDGLPEQITIHAQAHSSSDQLADVPRLNPSPNNQKLLVAAKGLADAVAKMTNNVEGIPEQILIQANATSDNPHTKPKKTLPLTPEADHQHLLFAAEKLARAIDNMVSSVDDLPEQVLVYAESAYRDSPPENDKKLLNSARSLASALKKMTDTACALDTDHTSTAANAASLLVSTTIKDLKNDHTGTSLLEAAAELIISIKLLAKACHEDLSLIENTEPKSEIAGDVRASIFKILTNTYRQYIKDHDLLNPGSSLFGRKHGKEEQRAAILEQFIDSLIKVETRGRDEVDKDFSQLMQDTNLKYALGGIETETKECLTGLKRKEPTLSSQRTSKDSDE